MKSFLTAIRESQTRLIMLQHLLLPTNHLGKRKSEEDLGEKRRQEKRIKDSKAEEDRKKADYVYKAPRMRVNNRYCCSCLGIKIFEGHTCTACGHERCCEYLVGHSAKKAT
jgi:hypothetical protein